jgi:F-type H+-transporting ATPase subunit delta
LDIFSVLFGHFDSLTTSFIRLITNNRREYMLAEIAASFEAQWKAARGIVPVTIISATALDSATKESITKKIQAVVTGSLEINEIVDESLIGGFIVRMEDKQMDASVASQFNNLKQRLTR